MPSIACMQCGQSPLVITGGPFTMENIENIKIYCYNCNCPYTRKRVERLVEQYGR